jgi:hypothetical protein
VDASNDDDADDDSTGSKTSIFNNFNIRTYQ